MSGVTVARALAEFVVIGDRYRLARSVISMPSGIGITRGERRMLD
jgi:hypothetical protein